MASEKTNVDIEAAATCLSPSNMNPVVIVQHLPAAQQTEGGKQLQTFYRDIGCSFVAFQAAVGRTRAERASP